MPGNLATAAPSGVLPQTLSMAFTETSVFPMLTHSYHDGTLERSLIVDGVNAPSSIRMWRLTKRLASPALATLVNFIESHNGGLTPFYFYDPFDPGAGQRIGSNYDPSGAAIEGRHVCVFTMDGWSLVNGLGRGDITIEFKETA